MPLASDPADIDAYLAQVLRAAPEHGCVGELLAQLAREQWKIGMQACQLAGEASQRAAEALQAENRRLRQELQEAGSVAMTFPGLVADGGPVYLSAMECGAEAKGASSGGVDAGFTGSPVPVARAQDSTALPGAIDSPAGGGSDRIADALRKAKRSGKPKSFQLGGRTALRRHLLNVLGDCVALPGAIVGDVAGGAGGGRGVRPSRVTTMINTGSTNLYGGRACMRKHLLSVLGNPADTSNVAPQALRAALQKWVTEADKKLDFSDIRDLVKRINESREKAVDDSRLVFDVEDLLRLLSMTEEDLQRTCQTRGWDGRVPAMCKVLHRGIGEQRLTSDHMLRQIFESSAAVGQMSPVSQAPTTEGMALHHIQTFERVLGPFVTIVVLVNLAAMGISIDFEPSHPNWMVLEVFCTVVFVLEAVLKITVLGWKYFTGPCRYWNIADLAITLLSVVETSISTYIYSIGTSGGAEEEIANFARLAVVARVLRIARIMRIIRLVQTPLLKDFVNMTLGFAIGMPALFCVLCCFCVILFTFGLLFRTSFGPLEGQDEISVCGDPDNMSELVSDVGDFTCHAHYMYGEEYFGSMRRSMFTSFRFMLGDYSTRGGKSLIVAFSQGYGYKFDAVFVVWMIIVVFGFFNIVTAIFVDSTTSGLKHSDVKRRHEQQYARKYVQRKFRHLMHRVLALKRSAARGSMSPARSQQEPIHRAWLPWAKKPGSREFELEDSRELDEAAVATMEVTEKEFVGIMGDPEVQQLLQDLDIDSFNPAGWYDTFDPEGKGSMTLLSLLQSVMRLRGQPQKNDAIAAFLSLRALHAKVDDVQHSMLQAVARRSP